MGSNPRSTNMNTSRSSLSNHLNLTSSAGRVSADRAHHNQQASESNSADFSSDELLGEALLKSPHSVVSALETSMTSLDLSQADSTTRTSGNEESQTPPVQVQPLRVRPPMPRRTPPNQSFVDLQETTEYSPHLVRRNGRNGGGAPEHSTNSFPPNIFLPNIE